MAGLRRRVLQRGDASFRSADLPAEDERVSGSSVPLRVSRAAARSNSAERGLGLQARDKPATAKVVTAPPAIPTPFKAKLAEVAPVKAGTAKVKPNVNKTAATKPFMVKPAVVKPAVVKPVVVKPARAKAARTRATQALQPQSRSPKGRQPKPSVTPVPPTEQFVAPLAEPGATVLLEVEQPPGPALQPEAPAPAIPLQRQRRARALFVLDMHTFDEMHAGEIPIIPYSHDRNVLLLAHVVARRNIEILVSCGPDGARERKYRRVTRVYPRWEFTREFVAEPETIEFDLIVCAGIEALIMRDHFPEAKLVGILPALHMFEAPGLFRPRFVFDFIQSLRNQIDFIITQNERMRETLVFVCHWLARWDPSDRVFTARLGLSRDMESVVDVTSEAYRAQRSLGRQRLGLGADDVLIVNAGGAWNWTDCDTFLEAVCLHARQGGKVRVYFSGITQPDNHEVNRVRDRILELLVQYPECFSSEMGDGRPIYIERDWSRGGRDIHTFLKAGDLGLSVNKVGFEGWQSHRVRIVDYIGSGLPLLAAGDDLLTREFCQPQFRAVPGSLQSYGDILARLEEGGEAGVATLKRQVVGEHRAALDGDVIYGRVIDHIMRTPRRTPESIAGLERNFLELIQQQSEDRLRDEVQQKLRKMLDL